MVMIIFGVVRFFRRRDAKGEFVLRNLLPASAVKKSTHKTIRNTDETYSSLRRR